MNTLWFALQDLFKWVPDWHSCVYIGVLALLILSRRTHFTLIFLFISAYLWGMAYLSFQKPDAPIIFHIVYRVAGAMIILGIIVHFWRQRSK